MDIPPVFVVQVKDLETLRPVVSVCGEIDLATSHALANVIAGVLAEDPLDVVLDLGKVTFMDCSGVSIILATRNCLPMEAKVILRQPQPLIRKLIGILELNAVCVMEESAT